MTGLSDRAVRLGCVRDLAALRVALPDFQVRVRRVDSLNGPHRAEGLEGRMHGHTHYLSLEWHSGKVHYGFRSAARDPADLATLRKLLADVRSASCSPMSVANCATTPDWSSTTGGGSSIGGEKGPAPPGPEVNPPWRRSS